jgi:hypothetical protein
MRRPKTSTDPDVLRQELRDATDSYRRALEDEVADRRAGRMPRLGGGTIQVLARRVAQAQANLEAVRERHPA